jgi:hypothetical protein
MASASPGLRPACRPDFPYTLDAYLQEVPRLDLLVAEEPQGYPPERLTEHLWVLGHIEATLWEPLILVCHDASRVIIPYFTLMP